MFWCYGVLIIYMSALCPAGELVSVSLNEVVRLQCPALSQMSKQLWQRPNSQLLPDRYLHLEDGSLSFVATPTTLGHYLCLSTENGYQQTMAIYHVKLKSSLMSQTPTSYTWPQMLSIPTTQAVESSGTGPLVQTSVGTWPNNTGTREGKTEPALSNQGSQVTRQLGRNLTLWKKEFGNKESEEGKHWVLAQSPCYLRELVVVSVLLVLCLSIVITMLLYIIRQRCHSRMVPQVGTLIRDSNKSTAVEQEVLGGNQFLGRQACGFVCNGKLADCNGDLPI